ncbi:hypothetical protein BDV93DRAFT_602650 [Ceratobasidium sp. AG-I]|nr:hypothetical protein BDV93DRAFT_602650 [Ceratobasidium sp. AG-I]
MPLPHNGPVALHGAPLTPPPPSGPHKPNLAIQARLAPELIAAIIEARKKGQQLQFEAYGPNAGFHIDGQHFPLTSVAAERTPHEVYAYNALPQPTLQVIGKVVGKCNVQRTLTEEDQEKLRQSHSAAETASQRTIARVGVPEAPVKTGVKRKTATVRKNVLDADTLAALRASPAPGTAGNSPPPGAPSRSSALDGPPNPFQTLLIHHLAYAPSTLKNLASAVKRQPKEIRGCLDSIATNDDSTTGPRPDVPTWTLKPAAYQYLRLVPPNGSASGGPWLTLTPDDIKRIAADANRAFDELKLPPDAQPRVALAAALKPAPPPAPPTPVVKPQETSTLKHPLPARPTPVTGISNGRLDIARPSRVASPAAVATPEIPAPSREVSGAPVRPPVRASAPTKEKVKVEGELDTPKDTPVKKSKTKAAAGTNGKEKTSKIKSKAIIPADSDGEDFVATKRDRERKPPPPIPAPAPVAAPTPTPTPAPVPPRATVPAPLHSRNTSSSSSRQAEPNAAGVKRVKREVDIALELEREIDAPDSAYGEPSRPVVSVNVISKPAAEGKKRRVVQEETPRAREVVKTRDVERPREREGERPREKEKVKESKEAKASAVRDPARVKPVPRDASEVKRKRRDIDQESDVSFDPRDADVKKKRRMEPGGAAPVLTKRDKPPREREADLGAGEARPKKPLPTRESDSTPRQKGGKVRMRKVEQVKTNGASTSAAASAAATTGAKSIKTNGSSKKERVSVTYTSSEDESTPPAPRRTAPAPAPPAVRPPKPPAPSPSEGSTPRERERDRERDRRKPAAVVLPTKRPPLPANASAMDVRDRYSEVYAEYTGLGATLATERVKIQRLLRDIEEGDHEALLESSVVESLTKAYREAHEELAALKVRLGTAS